MAGDIHVILNPVAGGGKAHKLIDYIIPEVEEKTKKKSILHITTHQGEATSLVRRLINNNAGLIVAVGGDGTIHETINGFFENGKLINPACELAIVPCGTGEDLAKSLKLPQTLEEQIQLIVNPQYTLLDAGRVQFTNTKGEKEERYFLNECQVGIGGSVVKGVSTAHKYFGGTLAFGSVTLKHAVFYKARQISVLVDDKNPIEKKLYGVVAGNGSFCGGGMKLTPDALLNDGLFDILLIEKMNIFNRLIGFSNTYSGKHLESPFFKLTKGRKIYINSKEPLYLESDGELLGTTPCAIELIPNILKMKCIL